MISKQDSQPVCRSENKALYFSARCVISTSDSISKEFSIFKTPLSSVLSSSTSSTSGNVPRENLSRLDQTPLVLALRLAHRHKDVLVACLFSVACTLALGLHLGLADCLCRLVLVSVRLALLGELRTLLLGQLAQTSRCLDLLSCKAVVAMAVFKLLLALTAAAKSLVDLRGHAELLELGEISGCKDGCRGELGDAVNLGLLLLEGLLGSLVRSDICFCLLLLWCGFIIVVLLVG